MRKLHFFPGLVLETELQPDGYYSCFEHDEYDLGCLVTYGRTREAAIEDYADALDEREAALRAKAAAAATMKVFDAAIANLKNWVEAA